MFNNEFDEVESDTEKFFYNIFDKIDTDKDNYITLSEFLKFI